MSVDGDVSTNVISAQDASANLELCAKRDSDGASVYFSAPRFRATFTSPATSKSAPARHTRPKHIRPSPNPQDGTPRSQAATLYLRSGQSPLQRPEPSPLPCRQQRSHSPSRRARHRPSPNQPTPHHLPDHQICRRPIPAAHPSTTHHPPSTREACA